MMGEGRRWVLNMGETQEINKRVLAVMVLFTSLYIIMIAETP